ncbi:putative hypoxia up-regulated protein 1 isoform X2 [Penaeus vannamei]|uniref:Hypoxia up-regulated protein 1 n=1 Tax=Penaeus vannamei TaxID=6689 RepID=A0A423SSL9_PENVA|nr:putative hypoxia up-regulated protein 1 isoform X2 [Penaeus vannamei]
MPGLYDPPPPDFLTCTCSLEPAIHTQGLQLALGPRALGTLGPRYGRYSLQGSLRVCGLCTGLHMGPQPAPSKLASDWKKPPPEESSCPGAPRCPPAFLEAPTRPPQSPEGPGAPRASQSGRRRPANQAPPHESGRRGTPQPSSSVHAVSDRENHRCHGRATASTLSSWAEGDTTMMVPDVRWTMGLSLLVLLGIIGSSSGVTIMSIDFGSEWIKVAVVAPGVPMEIVLNKESKRKTPGAVSFRNGERTFGEDALTTGIRFPANNYFYLLDLLGKKIDNPIVELYKKRFPFYNIEADPERGTVVFRHNDDTTYTVEELIAQMLAYAKDMAMSHTEQRIKDCVITVPPFFNQVERRAMLTAAELAGLKVLSLMSSNAAVALNYGMFRRKEINATAHNILFYDMGASSTIATIVSYQTVKTKDRGYTETNPQVTVLGLGYDRTLGGLEMQMRLRDYLAKKFNEIKKTPNNVLESPRALAKLMKEAGRLKKVLSANSDHLSQIEGLLDEEDFKTL